VGEGLPQEIERHHQHARRQKPHCSLVLVKGLLRGGTAVGGEPFDGHELRAVRLHRQHDAGARRFAVEVNGARAAHAMLATDMGAGEAEVLAQEIREELARLASAFVTLAVDGESNGDRLGHGLL
jgi:hypothetical protein